MKEKIIILDTETTDADEKPWMIQLWYIVCDIKFNEIKRENLFFHTDKLITFEAMAIHHITEAILQDKITEDRRSDKEKKELILSDFENAYLVAHNSPFDKNVLDCNWIETHNDQWIDTYNIAYSIYTDDDFKHNLQYLRYALGCEFDEEINPHDALSDVIVLKEVFKTIYFDFIESLDWVNPLEKMVNMTQDWIILRKWMLWKYKWLTFAETFKRDPKYFLWFYNTKKENWQTKDALFNTIKYYLKWEKTEEK